MYQNAYYTKAETGTRHRVRNAQTYFVKHDFEGPAKLTTTLIHALSDVVGCDVSDSEFTLYNYVDPDALNHLFKPKEDGTLRTNGHLTFTVQGHLVTVYSDGQIAIVPPRNQPGHPQA